MVVNNPNNWHWVDKNCIDWTKQYFKDKLVNYSIDEQSNHIVITNLKKLEGDVEVCQRKGKVISLFDFNLSLDVSCNDDVKGTISVPEVAYDTEKDDFQFEIQLDGSLNEVDSLKKIIRSKLVPFLREVLAQFGDDLITTQSSDIQVSQDKVSSQFTKANQSNSVKTKSQSSSFINKSSATSTVKETNTNKLPEQRSSLYNTTSLKFSDNFHTTAEQVYITLLDPQRVAAWTRSPPEIEGKEGGEFKLFGGNIVGKFIKLIPNEQLQMLWRINDWKLGHYTTLTIDLKQNSSDTTINVQFEGVPIGEEENVEDNFKDHYIRSIKLTFGFGAVL